MPEVFGTAYRQEVQDTNEGAIKPENQALSSKLSISGRKIEYSDPTFTDSRDDLIQGILRVGNAVVTPMVEADKQKRFSEGYVRGANMGLEEAAKQNPGLLERMGSDYKGFQQGVIENSVNQHLSTRVQNADIDVTTLDIPSYGKALQQEATEIAKQYKDPTTRAAIMQGLTKNAQVLAKSHAQKRTAYETDLRNQEYVNSVYTLSESLDSVAAAGDPAAVEETAERLLNTIERPDGMEPDQHSELLTTAAIGLMRRGKPGVYEQLVESGMIDNLHADDRDALETEAEKYDSRYSAEYVDAHLDIMDCIQKSCPDTEQRIEVAMAKWPSIVNPNDYRELIHKRNLEIAEQAKEDALDVEAMRVGGERAHSMGLERKTRAFNTIYANMGRDLVYQQKMAQIHDSERNGTELTFNPQEVLDGDYVPSKQEIDQAHRANPGKIVSTWRRSQVPLDAIRQGVAVTSSLMASSELTESGLVELKEQMTFLNHFQNADPQLFAKSVASEDQLADFDIWNKLVIENGEAPRNVLEQMREIKKRPEIDILTAKHLEGSQDTVDTLYEDFLADNSQWLWVINDDPENEALMKEHIAESYEEALRITRGDKRYAAQAARGILMRNSAIIGDNFVAGGAKLQKNAGNYNLEAFIRGQNYRALTKDQLRLNGFPPDIDLLNDDRVAIRGINNNTAIQFSMLQPGTNQRIIFKMRLPSSDEHMFPYIEKKYLGFKPYSTAADVALGITDTIIKAGGAAAEKIKSVITDD